MIPDLSFNQFFQAHTFELFNLMTLINRSCRPNNNAQGHRIKRIRLVYRILVSPLTYAVMDGVSQSRNGFTERAAEWWQTSSFVSANQVGTYYMVCC